MTCKIRLFGPAKRFVVGYRFNNRGPAILIAPLHPGVTSARKSITSLIEFAAAHEEMASGIGTDEAAFVVEEFRATDGTIFPPILLLVLLGCGRFKSIHVYLASVRGGQSELLKYHR